MLAYDPFLPKLIITDNYQLGKNENINRILLRYLYLIIYFCEIRERDESKIRQTVETAYATEIFIKDNYDDIRLLQQQQKSDSSIRKISQSPVDSPSTFSEITISQRSNEEDKNNEKNAEVNDDMDQEYRGRSIHKESDDWQIEDTKINF